MRILIVEDDPRLAGPIADDLRRQSHIVDLAVEGSAGFNYAARGLHDLVLLDVLLPGENGLNVCRRLRHAGNQAMILMITALDAIEDKVAALDAGADDYIVKPFDLAELSARIRAVARRPRELRPATLRHGNLLLDPHSAVVTIDGRSVTLTRTEYLLCETLMGHPRQLFTREALRQRVSSIDRGATLESIRTHMGNMRRKLLAAGCTSDPIETVYGSGYRFANK